MTIQFDRRNSHFWATLMFRKKSTLDQLQQSKKAQLDIVWGDSTTVNGHRHGGGAPKKKQTIYRKGEKGWSTKIHLALSPHGFVNVVWSEGQRQEMKMFASLCQHFPWHKIKWIIADKGYSTSEVKKWILSHHCEQVIPPKMNRCFPGTDDKKLDRTRVKIENFFSHLKE